MTTNEEARHRLAERARRALELAGLPVGADSGVTIEVDAGADDSGGVYVFWSVAPALRAAAAMAAGEGTFEDPAIERSGRSKAIMRDALLALLTLDGISAEPTDDHGLRPFEVRVLS